MCNSKSTRVLDGIYKRNCGCRTTNEDLWTERFFKGHKKAKSLRTSCTCVNQRLLTDKTQMDKFSSTCGVSSTSVSKTVGTDNAITDCEGVMYFLV